MRRKSSKPSATGTACADFNRLLAFCAKTTAIFSWFLIDTGFEIWIASAFALFALARVTFVAERVVLIVLGVRIDAREAVRVDVGGEGSDWDVARNERRGRDT